MIQRTKQAITVTSTAQQEQCTETTTEWDKKSQLSGYSKRWQLEISKEPDAEILKEAFKNHMAIAISDGSFKTGWGVAAWTIGGGNKVG